MEWFAKAYAHIFGPEMMQPPATDAPAQKPDKKSGIFPRDKQSGSGYNFKQSGALFYRFLEDRTCCYSWREKCTPGTA